MKRLHFLLFVGLLAGCDDDPADAPSADMTPGDATTDTAPVDSQPGDAGSTCGDGTLDAGEACDDGNTAPGDGCDATCQTEPTCGDGTLDAGEACDDGNTTPGDGCAADCLREPTLALVRSGAAGQIDLVVELQGLAPGPTSLQFTVRFDPLALTPRGPAAAGADAAQAGKSASGNVQADRWRVLVFGFNADPIPDPDGDHRRVIATLPFSIAAGSPAQTRVHLEAIVVADTQAAPIPTTARALDIDL